MLSFQTQTKPQTWLATALDHPRGLWLRHAIFQMHLWTGLGVGLLSLVIGLTGSAIVFREELDAKLSPSLYTATAPYHSIPNLDAMLTAVQRRFPGRAITGASPSEHGVWLFSVSAAHPVESRRDATDVFVDPNNRILGERGEQAGLINTLAFLHIELLTGDTGRIVNGIGAILLLFLAFSGVVLWWPGRTRWRGALKIRLRARWPRLNWDLHTAGGFFASIFIVAQAITAIYLCFAAVAPAISILTGGHADDMAKLLAPPANTARNASRPAPLEAATQAAQNACSGCSIRFISFPATALQPIGIFLDPPGGRRTTHLILDYFDRNDGHRLQRIDSNDAPFGIRLMLFFSALHFGLWGGLMTRVLWLFLGLTPGALFLSGFLMWWRRVLRKR